MKNAIHSFFPEASRPGASWEPTAANINALPEPLRRYIHDLETNADPAGMVAENILLRDHFNDVVAYNAKLKFTIERIGMFETDIKQHAHRHAFPDRIPPLQYIARWFDGPMVYLGDGYLVYLYTYRFCGCGPHPTSVVELRVTRSGEIEALSRQEVFRDPEEDNLCID